jgi:type VI secretion system protein ImpL
MIKKILKVLFIIALLVGLAIISLFACLFFRVPLWWSIVIFFGVILSYYLLKWLFKLFRRYLRKRKLGEDEEEQPADQSFEESFDNAILHSKNYHKEHKKKLPWYILLGNLDSGKSSLVNGSRVYTLSENIDPNAEVLPTQTAHCWALDDSVIAETSGAMFLAKPSRVALRAWKKLVYKIKLHKRHIKLKGFVATVSVDQLQGDADALAQYAQDLRQKVEKCSKQIGLSFPVYLIITKADRLQGFESFSFALPEEVRQQAFGKLFNESEFHSDSAILINEWQRYLSDRIRGFNTLQLQANNSLMPRVMLFNNHLDELKKPLTKFLNAFFRVSAQVKADNPVLRGMFITSAKQESGVEVDSGSVLEGLSISLRSRLGAQDLFIHDIFAKILPTDYYLYNKFSKNLSARRRYYRQAISVWWFVFIGGAIYLGIAYAHAIKALVEINQVSKVRENQFSARLNYNLLLLSNMNQDIQTIEGIKENWFFSVWPYSQAFDDIVLGTHQRFVNQFNKYVMDDLRAALVQSADIVTKPNHKQNYGFVVQNIVEKINLIQAKLDLMPESAIESLHMDALLINDNFKTNSYGVLYKNYISWNPNLIQLKKQRGDLLKLLDSLDLFDQPFGWLTSWVDEVSNIQPITAGTYWPENKFPTNYMYVKPVYTQDGYQLIQALFNNIANVQLQPTEVEQYSLKFFAEYDLNRYKTWEEFAHGFRQDIEYIPSEAAWYATAQLPLTESPYFYYATTIHKNFTDKMLLQQPEWLKLFFNIDKYYEKSLLALQTKEELSWWAEFINYLDKYTRDFKARVDGVFYDESLLKAMNTYELSLMKLQKYVLTLDQESSFNVAASLFSDAASSPSKGGQDSKDASKSDQSEFYKAFNAYQQVKFFATNDFNLVNRNEATWNLIKGMFDLYFHGVIEKSMCYVGQMWKNKVINNPESSVINNSYSLEELFGQKSDINQFMVKYVYPFILYKDSKHSYVPKPAFGHTFEFSPFVYSYARDQYQYVKLQMLQKRIENIVKSSQELVQAQIKPTNVNQDAKLFPDSTTVTVVCEGKKHVYNNYDMVSNIALTNDIFKCTYAEVSINFEGAADFSAVKKYIGDDGLLELVNEYSQGQVNYKASDFPEVYSQLQNYDVNDLSVFIDFKGLNAIKSLLIDYTSKKAALTSQVYGKLADWKYLDIVSCWGDQSWTTDSAPVTAPIKAVANTNIKPDTSGALGVPLKDTISAKVGPEQKKSEAPKAAPVPVKTMSPES